MIAGNGVHFAGAEGLLRQFAERTDIPVLTTMNAADLQGEDRFGFIGVYGNRIANTLVKEADLVLSVGARLSLRQVGNRRDYFAPHARLIRADIDPYELGRNIKEDEEKHLEDAKDFLAKLLSEEIPKFTRWKNLCREARELLAPFDREVGNRCIEAISALLPQDPIVAVDVGQNQCWAAQSFTLKGEGRLLIGGGYGSMGCGLPYAIGASIAANRGVVFCVTGDGGLQMNIQELQTVAREGLPIKILVLNNRALGKISEVQAVSYDSRFAQTTEASGYTVPDFEKVSRAYGIRAATLSSHEELGRYAAWLTDPEPCLLNILLPEDTRLIPKVNWNASEIRPRLDEGTEARLRALFEREDGDG